MHAPDMYMAAAASEGQQQQGHALNSEHPSFHLHYIDLSLLAAQQKM
jgi:hypothetical protein